MAPRRNTKQVNAFDYKKLTAADVLCPICKSILIKPITLPCNHSFCASCFDESMKNANFTCPLCRIRIRSWLRSAKRGNNSLVNEPFWLAVQSFFPLQVRNKMNGVNGNIIKDISTITQDSSLILCKQYDKRKTKDFHNKDEGKIKMIEVIPSTSSSANCNLNNNNKNNNNNKEENSQLISSNVVDDKKKNTVINNKGLVLNNLTKKEYTCRILCQNEIIDNKPKYFPTNTLVKKNFKQLQKIIESDIDDSSDSIESECIYFKPIDYRHNPPSQRQLTPIKVPTKRATINMNVEITPPTGQNQITMNCLESAFARLLSSSKSSTETLIISKKNKDNINNTSRTQDVIIVSTTNNNNNNNKRKNVNNKTNNDVSKKLKVTAAEVRNNNKKASFCDIIENDTIKSLNNYKNNYFKQITDESVKKILQEKADLEFARRLQEEYNQSNKYSTRSRYSKRIASAKIQVLTK